tara:strand:+ start:536 stop:724 length:189 start_codon:yes stop_codon:yes gene_type:complete
VSYVGEPRVALSIVGHLHRDERGIIIALAEGGAVEIDLVPTILVAVRLESLDATEVSTPVFL